MATFETTKNDVDFGMGSGATDITIPADSWTQIGSLTVGAQTAIQFGVGVVTANGTDSRETATIRIDDTAGNQITSGKLRLRIADANENRERTVAEGLLTEWSAGKKLGRFPVGAREDDKLKIEVRLNASQILDMSDTNTDVSLPVTVTTRR